MSPCGRSGAPGRRPAQHHPRAGRPRPHSLPTPRIRRSGARRPCRAGAVPPPGPGAPPQRPSFRALAHSFGAPLAGGPHVCAHCHAVCPNLILNPLDGQAAFPRRPPGARTRISSAGHAQRTHTPSHDRAPGHQPLLKALSREARPPQRPTGRGRPRTRGTKPPPPRAPPGSRAARDWAPARLARALFAFGPRLQLHSKPRPFASRRALAGLCLAWRHCHLAGWY